MLFKILNNMIVFTLMNLNKSLIVKGMKWRRLELIFSKIKFHHNIA